MVFRPRVRLTVRGVFAPRRCYVLVPDADKLTPADPRDVETCLSLGLTSGSRLAKHQAAEVTAKVVAERLVAELVRSGFVIMRKPISVGDGGSNPGARTSGL